MNAAAEDLERLRTAARGWNPDRAGAIKRARAALAPAMEPRTALEYPTEALGPLLAPACEAISVDGQVRAALVGQSLLGAASLLTQGLYNVQTLAGVRPLSLYMLTLGDSGDGKSVASEAALRPVTEWQRAASARYRAELDDIERSKAARKRGEKLPQVPAQPYRLVSDATVEGLRRDLDSGPVSQGVFSDEAAAVLAGYGMSPDHRAKTAAVFSKLWDNGHLSVSRAVGGRVEQYGRRLAIHWLIQPAAAAESVADPMLSALGFWPRYLSAWPEAQAPRLAREFRPDRLRAVGAYWARCSELLAEPLGDDAGDCPVISLSDDARHLLAAAFEGFERAARGGDLRVIKPFALRAAELACRVAGVLTAFAGNGTVDAPTMRGALALVSYSLATWKALIDEGAADQRGSDALRLYEWLTTRPGWTEALAVIVNRGPACVRSRDKRDAALDELVAAGLVSVVDGKAVALDAEGL